MRLWHWKLIPALPRHQLLGQWRECCAIAKNMKEKGTPNHILVNKVQSSRGDFFKYCQLIYAEMKKRGYEVNDEVSTTLFKNIMESHLYYENAIHFSIFPDWHNIRYLRQCYYNLQEKYDCGAISEEEWNKILEQVKVFIDARFMDV